MSHSLHNILRCDVRIELPQPDPEGRTTRRCPGYKIGRGGQSVPELREDAALEGWTRKPGKPYPHLGGRDMCPSCSKGSP